ncbi:hypothetical protein M419DRAFT_4649 [Trichoderma reesei RUT C-30]|uniref:YDG domain-containing protein n=1 Tax=Hypocrea jecorina (strain ATCC 56765 / BCRC 32924 / NRRL 11460 / Rut C-30) TaxID=1344414 RepID=A0A024SJR5_HYPJR|nr:hypothetical protein M419DRAFT_4649 [Trichoderma reesei RUT C-30]
MFDFGGNGLNEPKLLDFSDEIRSHLLEDHSLGPWAETVKRVFRKLLRDEGAALPAVSFATIQNARLDKLLSDILTLGHQQVSSRLRPRLNIAIAERLQRSWMARFREEFFNIDQTRQEDLSKSSRLKDVVFNKKAANGWELWKAAKCKTWLNLACAYRDGIVGAIKETPTKGRYGAAALPLLTGREEVVSTDTVRYMREARLSETHISLISHVGSQIRILRGHRLRSPLSPQAGIRYDGLYIVRRYSLKQISQTRLHRIVVTLERISKQPSMTELARIPLPSQMDDWLLFEKHEGEMIRQHRGEQSFLEWKLMKAQERMDRRQWRRALEVGAALTNARNANTAPECVTWGSSKMLPTISDLQ